MMEIFVHPLDVQNEGIQQVFDNLEAVGTTVICNLLRVARPADKGLGVRFPPLHVHGYRRVVARPGWGKRELHFAPLVA